MKDLLNMNSNKLIYKIVEVPKESGSQKLVDEYASTGLLLPKNDTINLTSTIEIANSTETQDPPPQQHTEELYYTDNRPYSTEELCAIYGLFALTGELCATNELSVRTDELCATNELSSWIENLRIQADEIRRLCNTG